MFYQIQKTFREPIYRAKVSEYGRFTIQFRYSRVFTAVQTLYGSRVIDGGTFLQSKQKRRVNNGERKQQERKQGKVNNWKVNNGKNKQRKSKQQKSKQNERQQQERKQREVNNGKVNNRKHF
uniref:Uncharacterized protein n=1 Tax=Biomphalaria glabrata TaxID=6526 RepID=A0A2C9L2G2_BIOGL